MSQAELRERVDPDEFTQWRAYDAAVEPIGDGRIVRQLALIACLLYNAHRDPKSQAADIDEFDLYRERPPVLKLTRAQEEEAFRAQWLSSGLVVVKAGDA
jgi:hypothetical protein